MVVGESEGDKLLYSFYLIAFIRKFYRRINYNRKHFKPRLDVYRNKEVDILQEEETILEKWAENFEE